MTDGNLNLIYNTCNIRLNTSPSEGWGLVSFEHAATGATQLVPDHMSCSSLWWGYAEMLQPKMRIVAPGSLTDQHLISPDEVADKLQKRYENPENRHAVAQRCFGNAIKPEYQWQNIVEQWRT